jgi:hypothetical protein
MPHMPVKTKRPKRAKINCQYLKEQLDPVRSIRLIESEFTCGGCRSVLRQGKVFYCDLCALEFGPCCHPDFSETHQHYKNADVVFPPQLGDYLPPILCKREGQVRCQCCERMLCLSHTWKADISRLSLVDWHENKLSAVVLCLNCKKLLDPEPEPDESDEPAAPCQFQSEQELRDFLRQNPQNK